MPGKNHETARKYLRDKANYDKFPFISVSDRSEDCLVGWGAIGEALFTSLQKKDHDRKILIVETYQGVLDQDLLPAIIDALSPSMVIKMTDLLLDEAAVTSKLRVHLGDHPIFGKMNELTLMDFYSPAKVEHARKKISTFDSGLVLIYGIGSAMLCPDSDLLVYADMARWEIQQRFRRQEVGNLGRQNAKAPAAEKYKQAYFIDWRVCDRHKRSLLSRLDYVLDTNDLLSPKMISAGQFEIALKKTVSQPFRVVPFFDPGVWGGQWMKEVCDLHPDKVNYAWCFDCVPEENSLILGFGENRFEIPAINLVFMQPRSLLGDHVYEMFGAEFPIRFDFLDTMDGGNLSLQVHPMQAYIKEHFGMDYTQDESYYMLEVEDDAVVYLGLKDNVDRDQMMADLKQAQDSGVHFDALRYVNDFPVKKHDHVLIPAGTIHCSGRNSMVLEISATPYIFTFKLWDWGRLDLDGKPRTISLEHGLKNIQWDRTTDWVAKELVNNISPIAQGDRWQEEKTGLHELEFIETRRHWFSKKVLHDTAGNLNVLNLVDGTEAMVESPTEAFQPFIVHYAETFIIPAAVGAYTIRPYGKSLGKECATLKAFVR